MYITKVLFDTFLMEKKTSWWLLAFSYFPPPAHGYSQKLGVCSKGCCLNLQMIHFLHENINKSLPNITCFFQRTSKEGISSWWCLQALFRVEKVTSFIKRCMERYVWISTRTQKEGSPSWSQYTKANRQIPSLPRLFAGLSRVIEYSYYHMIFADGYSLACLLLSVTVASEGLSGSRTKNDRKVLQWPLLLAGVSHLFPRSAMVKHPLSGFSCGNGCSMVFGVCRCV